jgi:hypothetical protein
MLMIQSLDLIMSSNISVDEVLIDFPAEEDLMHIIMHTSSTVWGKEFEKNDIELWLSNFRGEVFEVKYERLIALWLLRHFTFYNQNEVTHLCRVIFRELTHKVISNNSNTGQQVSDIVNEFFQAATVITAEGIGGSGGFIAYIFRHANDLPMSLFNLSFSTDNISNTARNIIIIDDVTLSSGEDAQTHKFFSRYIPKFNNDRTPKSKKKKFYLLTLVSSTKSIEYFQDTFGIEVITAIRLDERDKCFNPSSDIFSTFPTLMPYARQFADIMDVSL